MKEKMYLFFLHWVAQKDQPKKRKNVKMLKIYKKMAQKNSHILFE